MKFWSRRKSSAENGVLSTFGRDRKTIFDAPREPSERRKRKREKCDSCVDGSASFEKNRAETVVLSTFRRRVE